MPQAAENRPGWIHEIIHQIQDSVPPVRSLVTISVSGLWKGCPRVEWAYNGTSRIHPTHLGNQDIELTQADRTFFAKLGYAWVK